MSLPDSIPTKKILALDQSLSNTGWAYCEVDMNGGLTWGYGCIKTRTKDDIAKKLSFICEEVDTLIKTLNPEIVILEEVYSGRSRTVYKKLLFVLGSLMALVASRDIQYVVKPAGCRKKTSWRYPLNLSSQKDDAFSRLKDHFFQYPLNEHSAEALCMVHSELVTSAGFDLTDFEYFQQHAKTDRAD